MGKSFDKFVSVMDNASEKVNRIDGLMAVKDAFVDLMPFIIVGSFGTLFSSVICHPVNGLARFPGFGFLERFQPIFSAMNFATMSILSIYLVYLVASTYSRYKKTPAIISGFTALCCYIALIPTSALAKKDDIEITVNNVIAAGYVDSKGLFLAIVVGLTSTILLAKFAKSDKLKIKMPPTVPPNVSNSFSALIPILFTVFIFSLFGWLFKLVTGMYISDAVYKFLQLPMQYVMQLPFGVIILVLAAQFFWSVGIHGSNIIDVVRSSVGLAAIAANLEASQAGQALPHVFTYTFWNTFCTIGGSGCTLGLIVAVFLVSKRTDVKAIAKLALGPMFFGINEPLIFGLPIVLNPLIIIPFILAPVVSATIGYIATAAGFAGAAIYTVPWTTPFILNAYLSTGGNLGTVITQILCMVVSTLIYLPFVKVMNSQAEE